MRTLTRFFARQWLGVMAPANWLATNPVVLQDVAQSNGTHLVKGFQNWLADVRPVCPHPMTWHIRTFSRWEETLG
jgi:poly(3-hydroxyalkanoate) synthetase